MSIQENQKAFISEKTNRQRNNRIDYLKACAILLVVLGHCLNYYNKNVMPFGLVGKTVLMLIYAVHVPLFFTISGYLCHQQPTKKYYKKKLIRIFVPFIVFSVLKIIFSFVTGSYAHNKGVLSQLITAIIFGELYWFSYAILLCYLFAPLLWKKTNGQNIVATYLLIITIVINCILYSVGVILPNYKTFFQVGKTLFYLPFFISGYLIRNYRELLREIFLKYKVVIGVAAFGVTCISIFLTFFSIVKSIGNKFPYAFLLAFSLMYIVYLIIRKIPNGCKLLIIISEYSYQIMLLDSFFKAILFSILYPILNIWIVFLIFIADVSLSVVVCLIAKRLIVGKYLMGL